MVIRTMLVILMTMIFPHSGMTVYAEGAYRVPNPRRIVPAGISGFLVVFEAWRILEDLDGIFGA